MNNIAANLSILQERIAQAAARASRNPADITLVAVSKAVGLQEILTLKSLGLTHFAENRIEAAQAKITEAGEGITWHFIGNLQRRKVRDTVALFNTIDAVDRISLAQAIQDRCEELGKDMPILIEVNVSGEKAKHGFAPADLPEALAQMRKMPRLQVRGLLTMAPLGADEATLRKVFGGLRTLAEEHNLPELSMGMSDDFEIAIEEGATQIRIGGALFE